MSAGFYRKDHLRKHTRSHESKRARDEAAHDGTNPAPLATAPTGPSAPLPAQAQQNTILPEITIHVSLYILFLYAFIGFFRNDVLVKFQTIQIYLYIKFKCIIYLFLT